MSLALLLILAVAADDDLGAARKLFAENLRAIRARDRAAYLACYRDANSVPVAGPEGLGRGVGKDSTWPDVFDGRDLQLVPLRPGVVYGTYRYRVRYGAREHSGLSERVFLRTSQGWKIAVTSAFDAPPGTPPPPLALVGATLVDGTGAVPVPDAAVVVRGGKIDCAGTRAQCPVPDGVEAVDLKGQWIAPGVVDAHVHFSQTGWVDGRPDAFDVRDRHPYEKVQAGLRANPERFLRSYLCSGVTAVFDVGGFPWTWDLRARAEVDTRAPHVAAAGPLLSTLDAWLGLPGEKQFLYLSDEKAAREGVRYLTAHGTDATKVWFINAPGRKFEDMAVAVQAAGAEARAQKVPLIVHATELRLAKEALRAGAKLLVHSVWDEFVDEEFLRLAKEGGATYCPTLIVRGGYKRFFESVRTARAPVVDDPNRCLDTETLARVAESASLPAEKVDAAAWERRVASLAAAEEKGAENLRRVHAAGIPVAMGTDAGNPLTLPGPSVYAEMEAMQAAGLKPMEVLVASTRNGAVAMGRGEALGTVEKGKAADLLVVAADPTADVANLRTVRQVMRGGVLRAVEELRP